MQIRGRHDDLGGALPGGASVGSRESYHEGILIPPVRIACGDEVVQDIKTLLLRNSRQAHLLGDDIDAQLGALRIGAARLKDLTRRYGAENLTACFADLLRECELAFRGQLIPQLPEKSWTARTAVESDGVNGPHELTLTLTRRKDSLHIGLDAAPQARGPINCPLEGEGAQFLTRLLAPMLLHLQDGMSEVPLNDGALRAFQVQLPEPGTILTPRFPAPTGLRALTLGKLLSAFSEALFEASGGRTPTGFDNLRTLSFWGHDEKGGFHLLEKPWAQARARAWRGTGHPPFPRSARPAACRRGDGGALSGAGRVDGAGAGLGRRGRTARRPGRFSGIPHAHRRRIGERCGKRGGGPRRRRGRIRRKTL